ncbi:MAG: hypothetical protein ACPLRW_07470 [Moorellales bacterium]
MKDKRRLRALVVIAAAAVLATAFWFLACPRGSEVLLPAGVVSSGRGTGGVAGVAVSPRVFRDSGWIEAANLGSEAVRFRVEDPSGKVLYASREAVPGGWKLRFRVRLPDGVDRIYVVPVPAASGREFGVGLRMEVRVI